MEETTQTTTEQPKSDISDGNKSETLSIVERADSAVKRLEDTEKRVTEKIKQLEDLEARRLLSGRAAAGSVNKTPEQVKEEAAQAEATRIVKRFRR